MASAQFVIVGRSCFYCSISKSCPPCRLRADWCWKRDFSASVSYCIFPTLLNVAEEEYLSEVYA